jgi:NAD(P)-dependent dehydrogenase (short-subunit alcohol dehydrogenase family)
VGSDLDPSDAVNEVAGQRILVMGASGGLGRALATRLVQQGATVAFAARRGDEVREAAASAGGDAIGVTCDVLDPDRCQSAVAEVIQGFGGLDALLYCAGIGVLRPLAATDAELWSRVLGTNVVGASLVTQACLPHLEASQGRAVYFSSVSASQTPAWPSPG